MKRNVLVASLATAVMLMWSATAFCSIGFDQDVTPDVIFGSGNTNGSFTTDRTAGVELGLRGKLRYNALGNPENTFNSNGDGTYSFDAGVAPTQSAPTAVWSFEWSINTDYLGTSGINLNGFTYQLGLDYDPTVGTNFATFDPINSVNVKTGTVLWDHAMGNNGTGNGGGSTLVDTNAANAPLYATALGENNVAQNSWKAHWVFGPSFDPTLDATYNIYLAAFDGNGDQVARTDIQMIIGDGGAVPEPGSIAIWSMFGIAGLVSYRRRKSTK